jgi:predicted transcriptional regulator
LGALLQVLTPRRLELHKVLHDIGLNSIRVLARRLKQGYTGLQDVYNDVQAERVGLIVRTADKRLSAPGRKW